MPKNTGPFKARAAKRVADGVPKKNVGATRTPTHSKPKYTKGSQKRK